MGELAGILRDGRQLESAHECLKEALHVAPGDPGILYDLVAVAE